MQPRIVVALATTLLLLPTLALEASKRARAFSKEELSTTWVGLSRGETTRKIRGPVMITRQRQLRTMLPSRPATPDELKGLPPCQDPPCDCVEP